VASLGAWNQPVWWPIVVAAAVAIALGALAWRSLRRRERMNARGQILA
jgi:membrane protein implicated in regulation of membrane protease activity